MKTSLLILGGALGVAYWMMKGKTFTSTNAGMNAGMQLAKKPINFTWASVPPVAIPKDPNSIITKINYYIDNPSVDPFEALFPNL